MQCPWLVKKGMQSVSNEPGSDRRYLARLDDLLLIKGANRQCPGDEKPTSEDQQGSDSDLPSDGEGHAERSNSLSLYPRDLTEIIASVSEGSFCFSLRMWTSTVRVVP